VIVLLIGSPQAAALCAAADRYCKELCVKRESSCGGCNVAVGRRQVRQAVEREGVDIEALLRALTAGGEK
jgi:hypothetical protein